MIPLANFLHFMQETLQLFVYLIKNPLFLLKIQPIHSLFLTNFPKANLIYLCFTLRFVLSYCAVFADT